VWLVPSVTIVVISIVLNEHVLAGFPAREIVMKLNDLLNNLVPESNPVVEKGILAAARAEIAKKNSEKVMAVTVARLSRLEEYKNRELANLREYRKMLNLSIKKVEDIDSALKYADSTGNIAPAIFLTEGALGIRKFCQELGCDTPEHDSPILKVPANFKSE